MKISTFFFFNEIFNLNARKKICILHGQVLVVLKQRRKKRKRNDKNIIKDSHNSNADTLKNQSKEKLKDLDPVVQSIVSLTILLRHKFVKQISAKVTNTLLFFVEKT